MWTLCLEVKKDHSVQLSNSSVSVTTNKTAASRDTSRHSYAKIADQSRTSLRSRGDRSAARSLVAAAVDLTVRQFVVVTFTVMSFIFDFRLRYWITFAWSHHSRSSMYCFVAVSPYHVGLHTVPHSIGLYGSRNGKRYTILIEVFISYPKYFIYLIILLYTKLVDEQSLSSTL